MPIGDGNTSDNQPKKPFKGTFDGDGTEIRNIYINKEDDQRDYFGVGLFGYAEDASFKNVGITGKICTNNNTITGGIVGLIKVISKPIEISNSYSKAEMINAGYCGGLIVEMYGKSEYKSLIQDCYNSGKFIFDKNWEGAFVGGIALSIDHAIINRCYNLADIDYSSSISSTIGGIVNTLNYSTVLNTYNLGNIKAKDDIAAGIVAYPGRDEIYNSYNIGDIYSDFSDWSGGIIGTAAEVVSNCYNLGNVTNGGAIVGTDGNSTVENVYYIKGKQPIGEITGVGNIINAVEIPESEMRSQKLVDALNANIGDNTEWARWKLGPKGYPVLDI